MKKQLIGSCPICENELKVEKLGCKKCGTKIEGDFELNKFSKLTREQQDFVEVFLKQRGNIKEIEKELGISYPTVRGRLDNVIKALGHKPKEDASSINRMEILEMLNQGKISAEEAEKLLLGKELF